MDDLHGDFRGIIDHLDHIQDLGIDVIYMTPSFKSDSCHKYDTIDYYQIDPSFGTTEDLRELVQEAHKRGMKIVMDAVFNHTGREFFAFEDIMEKGEKSKYLDWYYIDELPLKGKWGEIPNFLCFGYYGGMPKLNLKNPEVANYITDVACYWIRECDIDGWRLDVGDEISHFFWKRFRRAIKAVKKDMLIIGEIWHYAGDFLEGDEWDTVMNYDAFMEPLSWFLTGMEKHSDEENPTLFGDGCAFFEAMRYHMSEMPTASVQCAMNELSNHDHSRFMTRTNRRVGRLASAGAKAAEEGISYGIFRQGVVMQMTWPGAPTIYYGDEAGVCGWTDPDSRRTYPWGGENLELIEFHRYMSGIRKRCPAFRNGSLKALAAGDGYIAYGRFQSAQRAGGACCGVTAVNTGDDWLTLKIPVWQIGARDGAVLRREMMTYEDGYNAGQVEDEIKDGYIEVKIPPVGSIVLTGNDTAL